MRNKANAGDRLATAPPNHVYKINVDGAFLTKHRTGGWGFAIRDWTGSILKAGAGNTQWAGDALQTEAKAALLGLQRAA